MICEPTIFAGINWHFFGDFSVIKARKLHQTTRCKTCLFDALADGGLRSQLSTATVNQKGLESSVSHTPFRCIKMEGSAEKGELIYQYPHSIQPLLMSAQPSLRNNYGNMSRKY